jgi:hypothetical protein
VICVEERLESRQSSLEVHTVSSCSSGQRNEVVDGIVASSILGVDTWVNDALTCWR